MDQNLSSINKLKGQTFWIDFVLFSILNLQSVYIIRDSETLGFEFESYVG